MKEYKVMSQKDKWLSSKFDPEKLHELDQKWVEAASLISIE